MDTISNIPDLDQNKRVVIVGGGFAGLQLAKKLNKKFYQTVLIDKVNYYQFQPLLYQVATSGLEPSSIAYPHRKAFQNHPGLHFRTCVATRIVPSENVLETSIGAIRYDYLVIATGCDTNYFGNDTLRDNTFALKSVPEALLLRNKILISFEEALCAKNEEELNALLTFVIAGGGATGVELAGALADMKKTILPKDYPELDFSKMKIHLVDAAQRLLSSMSPRASANAESILHKRGVIIHYNAPVVSYDGTYVETGNGEKLLSRNVIWVAGITGTRLPGLDESAWVRGRLSVDGYNRVKGYDNVFALGDIALMADDGKWTKGHPQIAQVALQMAKNLARNLNDAAGSRNSFRKFTYSDRGTLATIGRNAAVADLGRFRFSGMFAWWLWLWVHILSIVGMKNRLIVFITWVWNYLTYDVSLRILIIPKFNKIYKQFGSRTR